MLTVNGTRRSSAEPKCSRTGRTALDGPNRLRGQYLVPISVDASRGVIEPLAALEKWNQYLGGGSQASVRRVTRKFSL